MLDVNFRLLGDEFYTIAEVLEEVRDAEARRRLGRSSFDHFSHFFLFFFLLISLLAETMSTKLQLRVPSKEQIQKVVEFANLTGDFASLSVPDIKLIALARQLEVEYNQEVSIRAAPILDAVVFKKREAKEGEEEEEEAGEDEEGQEEEETKEEHDDFYDGCVMAEGAVVMGEEKTETLQKLAQLELEKKNEKNSQNSKLHHQQHGNNKQGGSQLAGWGGDEWVTDKSQLKGNDPDKNLETTNVAPKDEDEGVTVWSLTADFAMQNVLVQMGLRVLSLDGRRITRVKQWGLRCFTCTKITRNMEKLFCPACGNNTLKRVSISVDQSGSVMAFFNPKKKISTRGTKYPMPKATGGRGQKFITDECELPKQKKNYKAKQAVEYGFADSRNRPAEKVKVGYGNKNPNETKRRNGKKKKKKDTNL
jgi:RNA-binding protein NOB1